jgi:hypothetical protein
MRKQSHIDCLCVQATLSGESTLCFTSDECVIVDLVVYVRPVTPCLSALSHEVSACEAALKASWPNSSTLPPYQESFSPDLC